MLLEIKFIKQRWSQIFFGYSVAYLTGAKNSLDQLKDPQLTLVISLISFSKIEIFFNEQEIIKHLLWGAVLKTRPAELK